MFKPIHTLLTVAALLSPFACAPPEGDDPFASDETAATDEGLTFDCGAANTCSGSGAFYYAVYRIGTTSTSRGDLLQVFSPAAAGTPTSLKLEVRKLRAFSSTTPVLLHAEIFELANAASPDVDALSPVASGSIDVASVSGTGSVTISLIGASLSTSQTYALVLHTDALPATGSSGSLLLGVGSVLTSSVPFSSPTVTAFRRGLRRSGPSVGFTTPTRFQPAGGQDLALGLTTAPSSGQVGTSGSASFQIRPGAGAVDPAGNGWFCGNNPSYTQVAKFAPNGTFTGFDLGGLGCVSIASDASGNIFAGEYGGGGGTARLWRISSTGTVTGPVAVGTHPNAVALDTKVHPTTNEVWVAVRYENNVARFANDGSYIASYAVGTYPAFIAFDPAGNTWVANQDGGTVTKVTMPAGTSTHTTLGGGPRFIDFDSAGNAFVATVYGPFKIFKLAPDGSIITSVDVVDPDGIGGLGVDAATGNVWVSTVNGGQVRKYSNSLAPLAAYPTVSGQSSYGMAFDLAHSAVWVSHYSNGQISRVGFDGTSTTGIAVNANPYALFLGAAGPLWVNYNGSTQATPVSR